jgi:hypothetical protein
VGFAAIGLAVEDEARLLVDDDRFEIVCATLRDERGPWLDKYGADSMYGLRGAY